MKLDPFEVTVKELHGRFTNGNDPRIEKALYDSLKSKAGIIAKRLLADKRISFTDHQIDEFSHDATTRLMLRFYQKRNGYRVYCYQKILYFEVLKAVYGNPNRKHEEHTLSLDISELSNLLVWNEYPYGF